MACRHLQIREVPFVTVTVRQTRDRSGDLSGGVTQNLKLFGATTNPASDISSILNVLNSGLGGNNAGSNTDAKSSTSGASSGGNAATTKATGESEKIAPATKAATANLSGGDTAASGGAPAIGASLKFANVTATSVSMDETFDRPLVIGFLALDIPIDFNGRLGSRPISTLRRIETAASGTTRHTTHEWAETSPTGIHDLELWINENDNACWLRDNGFTITTRKSTNPNHQDPCAPPGFEVDAKATANTLMQQMRDAGFWVGLKRTLFDGETKNRFGRLGSRIIGEIIDRPPGTGIDFVIAARRLVAAIETKSSDSNSSAAQIKEFNTQADQAQKNISSLDSSERPMLQQKLDVAKTRMNKK